MRTVLSGDWHLTDDPADEYRWKIFNEVIVSGAEYKADRIIIAGDIADKKDRHPGALVNRLVREVEALARFFKEVVIIKGNHDAPITGIPFWEFLGSIQGITYVVRPTQYGDILYLPYADDPRKEWQGKDLATPKLIVMHQTVTGVVGNNGHVLENEKMPLFPRGPEIWSGDIHKPQKVGRVNYVGAPHHVKFGDAYEGSFVILDERYKLLERVATSALSKHMAKADSVEKIKEILEHAVPGDQAKLMLNLSTADINEWPRMQKELVSWAEKRGVSIAGIEAVLEKTHNATSTEELLNDPFTVLDVFAECENLSDYVRDAGRALLKQFL